jgi:energy-converting hydrogenase Eha subunit A
LLNGASNALKLTLFSVYLTLTFPCFALLAILKLPSLTRVKNRRGSWRYKLLAVLAGYI